MMNLIWKQLNMKYLINIYLLWYVILFVPVNYSNIKINLILKSFDCEYMFKGNVSISVIQIFNI